MLRLYAYPIGYAITTLIAAGLAVATIADRIGRLIRKAH